jgi:glycosyltransferase involved in cell wall biosynthesis
MTKRKPKKNKTKKITPKTPVVQTVQNTPPAEKIEKKDLHLENTCKVSVIVPCYNVEEYLDECLQSVINQSLKDIEIICVDDGSTDGTLDKLNSYKGKDKRIKLIVQENKGAGLARNAGINAAGGEYIAFMDPDDFYPSEQTLENMYAAAVKNEVCICGGSLNQLKDNVLITDSSKFEVGYTFEKNELKNYSDYQFDYGYWRFIYKREFILKNDLYFPDYRRFQDPPFMVRAFILAKKFYALKEATYVYRVSYKTVEWTERKACDLFKGVFDVISLSIQNNLVDLYERNVIKLNKSYSTVCNSTKEYRTVRQQVINVLDLITSSPLLKNLRDFRFATIFNTVETSRGNNSIDLPIYIHENSAYSKGKIPLVSIIIPAYNSSDYLAECIESAQKQTLKNIEIICVNDGSFDNSLKIIEDFAAKDKRITVVSKKNGGLSSARNAGIKCVHGKYILFLDSDDMIKNDTAEKLSKYSEKNNLDLLFFDADSFFESKEMEAKNAVFNDYYHGSKEINEVLSGSELFVKLRENGDYRTSACMQLIRTERLIQNKIEFYEGILHEDNLFTFENILMAKRAAKRNWALYLRRVHEDSIMTTKVSFRNVYGYLKTYEGMMCFTQSHHFSEVVENNIKYLVLAIKKHVYNDFNSLSAEEKKKSSTLSLSEQLWFESAMGSKTELGVRQLFTNFTNQVALATRIDIKNIGTENSGVEIVESNVDKAEFKEPAYMVTPTGRGKVIENNKGALNFKVRAINSGSLTFFLRGIDLRGPDGKRIPAKVTYTSLRINGEEQLKAEQTVWHDIPFKFAKNVKDGDTFDVSITWKKAPPESFALTAPAATVTPPAPKTIVVEKPIGDKKLSDEIATLNKKVADLQNQLKLKDGENEKIKKEALENCERILNMVKTCSVPKVAQNKNDDATVQKLRKEITRIKSSHRYRIGSVITFIPGSIRRWFKRGKK